MLLSDVAAAAPPPPEVLGPHSAVAQPDASTPKAGPPGVPERSARLRFFISSEHTADDIDRAVAAMAEELAHLEREGSTMAKLMMAKIKS